VAAARKASRYFRSAICLRGIKPRSQIATIYAMQSPSTPPRSIASLARAVSRRSPHRPPPVWRIPFASAFQRPLTAHVNAGLCVVVLPAIGAFQRPSTQYLLHYWYPSDLVTAFAGVPSGDVQRTGCSACGLGYPPRKRTGSESKPESDVSGADLGARSGRGPQSPSPSKSPISVGLQSPSPRKSPICLWTPEPEPK
jgi:hypothetical protein